MLMPACLLAAPCRCTTSLAEGLYPDIAFLLTTGLTDVTAGFFDKLVKQLEKGFSSMEADYAGQVKQ